MTHTAKEFYGNPSSLHSEGKKSRSRLEEIRNRCAEVLDCPAENLIFTSGGSESDNLILGTLYTRRDKGRIIVSGIEHPAVWDPAQILSKHGWDIKVIKPGTDGVIRPENCQNCLHPTLRWY